jgi:hypothetical protein
MCVYVRVVCICVCIYVRMYVFMHACILTSLDQPAKSLILFC